MVCRRAVPPRTEIKGRSSRIRCLPTSLPPRCASREWCEQGRVGRFKAAPSRLQALPEPDGKGGFAQRPGGDGFHRFDSVARVEPDTTPVVGQEQARDDPGGAPVAIGEAMISRQTVSVYSRQIGGVRFAISCQIARPGQRSIDRSRSRNPIRAAMLGKLSVMDRIGNVGADPAPINHLASARRTSRSSCMISSAKLICRSNSVL